MDNKYINNGGICKYCNTKNINYTILNGQYLYFCIKCDKYITADYIAIDKPLIQKTLGELLTYENPIIKRNAMSILKTLNK